MSERVQLLFLRSHPRNDPCSGRACLESWNRPHSNLVAHPQLRDDAWCCSSGGRTQTSCILNCKYIYPTCSLKAVLIVTCVLIKQGRYFTVFVSRTSSIWHALEQVKHEISEELAMVKSAEIMAVVITYTWLFSLSFAYSPFIAHPSTPQRPNGDSI